MAGMFQAVPFSALQELSFFESTFVALLLVVTSLATVRIFTQASFAVRDGLGYGLLWGVVLLASPITVLVFAGCTLVGFFFNSRGPIRRTYVIFAAVSVSVAGLILLPWTVRNYLEVGGLFFVRDDFGLEMKVSNNSDATPLMDTNLSLPYFREMHPSDNPAEAQAVRAEGEKQYNRRALRTALAWISSHPTQFLTLTVRRFLGFWFTLGWPPWKGIVLIPMVLLAWAGCMGLIRMNPIAGWMLATIPILFPIAYYVIQTSTRYRFPAFWTVPFFASYALVSYFRRFKMGE